MRTRYDRNANRRATPRPNKTAVDYDRRIRRLLSALSQNTIAIQRTPAIAAILGMQPLPIADGQTPAAAVQGAALQVAKLLPLATVRDVRELVALSAFRIVPLAEVAALVDAAIGGDR